jgi:hypothetical protein
MIADEDAALFGGAHRALTFLEPAPYQQGRYWTPSPNIGTGVDSLSPDRAELVFDRQSNGYAGLSLHGSDSTASLCPWNSHVGAL